MRHPALLLLIAASGCSPSLKGARMAEVKDLRAPERKAYPDHDVVFLFKHVDVLHVEDKARFYSERRDHYALAILTEDGFREADRKLYFGKKNEVVDFEARTVAPDGTVHLLTEDNYFDDEAKDKDGFRVRSFSMPKVTVGSVIEVRSTVRIDGLLGSLGEYADSRYPVEHFRVTIEGPNSVKYAAQTYNSPRNWTLSTGGRSWRLLLELENVMPMNEDDDYRGSKYRNLPHWTFLIRQVKSGSTVYDWNTTWSDALDGKCKRITWGQKDDFDNFDVQVDVADCGGKIRCALERYLTWLRENVVFESWYDWPGRSAREVVESKTGSGVEKARILNHWLRQEGFRSYFALTTQKHWGLFDPDFPTPRGFSGIMLYLPAQKGLAEPLWVDPACEWCAVGQVSRPFLGQDAVVMRDKSVALATEGEVEARVEKITGTAPALSVSLFDQKATVDAEGNLRMKIVHRYTNRDAQLERDSTNEWDEGDHESYSKRLARDVSDVAEMVDHEPLKMVGLEPGNYLAERSVELELPGHLIRDGEELLLPLDFIVSNWDSHFSEPERTHPITFGYPFRFRQVVEVELPEGYRLSELPESSVNGKSPLEIKIFYERTERGFRTIRQLRAKDGLYAKSIYPQLQATTKALRAQRGTSLRLVRSSGKGSNTQISSAAAER